MARVAERGWKLAAACGLAASALSSARPAPPDPYTSLPPCVHPVSSDGEEADALAREVSGHVAAAAERVEGYHGIPFRRPVPIRVFATRERFVEASLGPREARAVTSALGISISPKLGEEPGTIPGVLAHELSHALLLQMVGPLRYRMEFPHWFLEGIAVDASGGGGAEGVTGAEAGAAIRAGSVLFVAPSGGVLHGQAEERNGLPPRMFYRQAGMFVSFLRARDVDAFDRFLRDLETVPFGEAFLGHFDATPAESWGAFAASLPAD